MTSRPLHIEPGAPTPLAPGEIRLTPEDVAAILNIPVRTLAKWRSQRKGPLPLTVGNHVRYRLMHVTRG